MWGCESFPASEASLRNWVVALPPFSADSKPLGSSTFSATSIPEKVSSAR